MSPTRPVLRYHGGKWILAPWIISHFPAHRVYVEPFGGAASVLMRKPRSYSEVYNDLDGEIVNLFRVLRDKRAGSVPSHDWASYPDHLAFFIHRLRGVGIDDRPYAKVFGQFDGNETLFYVDPPYVHRTRSGRQWRYCRSYRHEMTDADHEALAHVLHGVKGMVVLSGYPCELYDRLYSGWHRVTKDAHADGARDRVECLWLNDAATVGGLFSGGVA